MVNSNTVAGPGPLGVRLASRSIAGAAAEIFT